MKSYRKFQVLMFYRLGKKMRKPYGGGGWGVGATTNQNWFSKKKPSTGTELLKIQGYLLLIKSNNACKTKSNMWPSSNIAKVSLQILSAHIYTWNINTTRAKWLAKFVCYIEVSLNQGFLPFFHTFYYYWAKESHLLYQGLRWSFVILRFHWGFTVIHNPWPSRDNYTENSLQPPKTTNQNCLTPGPSCSQPPY